MNQRFDRLLKYYKLLFSRKPNASANIFGSNKFKGIEGIAYFYQMIGSVLCVFDIYGLPVFSENGCPEDIFAIHIHKGTECSGNSEDEFANTQGHYNPSSCPHPYHAGDLPPLFGNSGHAFSSVLTNRFTVDDIIGKTIVIHSTKDDFTSQPSGNSGTKIACGVIDFFS